MAYDRVDWHSGGDYPDDLPPENGGTHIGIFLAWAAEKGLIGEFHQEESQEHLTRLQQRNGTGRDFLLEACDGKFWDEDLNEEGNGFAVDYYVGDSPFNQAFSSYLDDYCRIFNQHAEANGFEYPSTYHVEDSWENYERVRPVLEQRFAEWQEWRQLEANRRLDPKEQFLAACQAAGEWLQPLGFKASRQGSLWKKTAADKDTVFTLAFEAERYNSRADVCMTVQLRIGSKALKKWGAALDPMLADDAILYGALRRSVKHGDTIVWQLAGTQAATALENIRTMVEQQVLPVFELFSDRPRALAHLAAQGSGFPGVSDLESTPMAYLLCFGTREQAQSFLDLYIASRPSPWRRNIMETFAQVQAGTDPGLRFQSYSGELHMKLAFSQGLLPPGAG